MIDLPTGLVISLQTPFSREDERRCCVQFTILPKIRGQRTSLGKPSEWRSTCSEALLSGRSSVIAGQICSLEAIENGALNLPRRSRPGDAPEVGVAPGVVGSEPLSVVEGVIGFKSEL